MSLAALIWKSSPNWNREILSPKEWKINKTFVKHPKESFISMFLFPVKFSRIKSMFAFSSSIKGVVTCTVWCFLWIPRECPAQRMGLKQRMLFWTHPEIPPALPQFAVDTVVFSHYYCAFSKPLLLSFFSFLHFHNYIHAETFYFEKQIIFCHATSQTHQVSISVWNMYIFCECDK